MKHSLVVDEMFPDGPGPFMDLEMVNIFYNSTYTILRLL